MNTNMPAKNCSQCLATEQMHQVTIHQDGICNQCKDYTPFKAQSSKPLFDLFSKIKSQDHKYDALVPISGGKDSTYVLYLAKEKYHLNVLCYTLDNGFMSDIAKENIERTIKKAGVDHVWYRNGEEMMKKLYRTALMESGEICGVCGIAIERSMLKVSKDYKIPLILLGHSPAEDNSFTNENIYDQNRLKAILKQNPQVKKQEVDEFLIYPRMNFITAFLQTKLGQFGRKINILYFEDLPSDEEIGEIIKEELDWRDAEDSEYTRHFDCLAEPFSNFLRDQRFGSSRRLPQLNDMIRNGEISKIEAKAILEKDQESELPANYEFIKKELQLSEKDIENIGKIPIGVYSHHASKANQVFALARKVFKN